VKFDVDQNGILNVSARDISTGKQASVKIEQSSGLSKDEIDRMRRDADEHAEEDRKQFELAEARNKGENLVYQLEKLMNEHKDKLTDADREPLNKAIGRVRDSIKSGDVPSIKSATEELEQASQAFSKTLYEKSAAAGGESSSTSSGKGSDDDAIDAEFEVKS
jgi:molecular chaperone DnaK